MKDGIEVQAEYEIAEENRRIKIEQAKQRLRKRRWWYRIFPFRITITRR